LTDETESLEIKCPLCAEQHRYRLSVDRSHVLYQMTASTRIPDRTYKRFNRLFTCPTKGEPFQAVIRLEQTFGTIIHNVKVVPDDIT
jgi:hypothetical protein